MLTPATDRLGRNAQLLAEFVDAANRFCHFVDSQVSRFGDILNEVANVMHGVGTAEGQKSRDFGAELCDPKAQVFVAVGSLAVQF